MTRSIIIVGAGPAGMAAAIEGVAHGCAVTLIDEAPRPGGQIFRQPHPALRAPDVADPAEQRRKADLLARFNSIRQRIDYQAGASAYAMLDAGALHVAKGEATSIVKADAIVMATGVREVAYPFPGWTTPGVMYAGAAQSLLKAHGVLPGKRVVVAGAGPLPLVVAAQIIRAGGDVAALAPLHPPTAALRHLGALWQAQAIVREGMRYMATIHRAGVPRWPGFAPVHAIGQERLEAVVLARLDSNGAIPGSEREVACDALAMNFGFAANSELPAMAGATMRHEALTGGWLPVVDALGRTSVPGLFVAGDAAGLRGALVAEAEGRIVGAAAARDCAAIADLPASLAEPLAVRRKLLRFQDAVRAMLAPVAGLWKLADAKTTVCRCESVALDQLHFALAGGHRSLNEIKRATRIGMGWCGGRTCMPMVTALAASFTGTPPLRMMTPRPLARPVTLAALARQTAA
jgi:NADPH-dependent 2,4-dienoyl-CoA reductase/sulfur reductase-like enzyme